MRMLKRFFERKKKKTKLKSGLNYKSNGKKKKKSMESNPRMKKDYQGLS